MNLNGGNSPIISQTISNSLYLDIKKYEDKRGSEGNMNKTEKKGSEVTKLQPT